MHNVKIIKSNIMFRAIKELLEEGKRVRITITGMSMYPFLREYIDSVELVNTNYNHITRGDIVLVRRVDDKYVLHRVLKIKKEGFYINGDAQQWFEGPLCREQLVAKVTSVWRKDRYISCSNFGWRFMTSVWQLFRPFRNTLIIGCYKAFIKRLNRRRTLP